MLLEFFLPHHGHEDIGQQEPPVPVACIREHSHEQTHQDTVVSIQPCSYGTPEEKRKKFKRNNSYDSKQSYAAYSLSGFIPALLQDESRNGSEECAHEAIEGPPVILQNEAPKDDESTQGVVDEHYLGRSSQDPIQQLQQEKLS